jgi:phosphoenolpyruvate---glycerone phosphotransferase subunit DhaL
VVTSAGTSDFVALLARVLARVEQSQEELDRLDAVVGDGDHGVTMVLGWRAVAADLAASPPTSPGAALRQAAESFASVGGTAGPLWGTALLRAGRALGGKPEVDTAAAAAAAAAALQGMIERGRCEEGMKTVVDAMAPAARALADSAGRDAPLGDSLEAAARAAAVGAKATARLTPQRGRAARAPERSRGHADPGAVACAAFWAAAADC